MADLNLAPPERRSLLVPILLALAVLAAAAFLIFRLSPRTTADLAVTHVELYPAHLVFKSDTRVVGADQTEDHLYLLVTVRLTDRLRLPLFLKDITATLVPSDGTLPPATSAVEQRDLPNLFLSFPALKKLAAAQTTPFLPRDTQINPGQTVEGYLILHFPVTLATWQTRNDAVLTLDLYHQPSLSISIPKQPTP